MFGDPGEDGEEEEYGLIANLYEQSTSEEESDYDEELGKFIFTDLVDCLSIESSIS
jgi:hypothetical protein